MGPLALASRNLWTIRLECDSGRGELSEGWIAVTSPGKLPNEYDQDEWDLLEDFAKADSWSKAVAGLSKSLQGAMEAGDLNTAWGLERVRILRESLNNARRAQRDATTRAGANRP